jgi:aminoglycoside phosphotransferase
VTAAVLTADDAGPEAALAAAGLSGAQVAPGPEAVVSPTHRAVESRCWRVTAPNGAPLFLKILHPELRPHVDAAAAVEGAAQAGRLGAGPPVLWSDPALCALLMPDMQAQGFRTADMGLMQRPAVMAGAMAALRRLHGGPALPVRFDPFAEIDRLHAAARAAAAPLPDDLPWVLRMVAEIGAVTAGAPLAPCRNDGCASNLLVGDDDAVLLLDFDRAGMNDPLYDVGALLAEQTAFEPEMAAAFAAYAGGADPASFARARLYAAVDDVMQALWSLTMAATTARMHLEFLKYGQWRLMRARLTLRHPQFEEKLRTAEGGRP